MKRNGVFFNGEVTYFWRWALHTFEMPYLTYIYALMLSCVNNALRKAFKLYCEISLSKAFVAPIVMNPGWRRVWQIPSLINTNGGYSLFKELHHVVTLLEWNQHVLIKSFLLVYEAFTCKVNIFSTNARY